MKKHWRLLNVVIPITALSAGILIGKIVTAWPLLTLKFEVDVISAFSSLLSIITTLIVAYWVSHFLDKTKEANRNEKELFIRRIESIYLVIEELNSKVSLQEIEFVIAAASLKRISVGMKSIFTCLDSTDLKIDPELRQSLNHNISVLRDLLTNTPVITPGNVEEIPIEIRDGVIHITNQRKLEIELAFDTLKTVIFNIELAINKS